MAVDLIGLGAHAEIVMCSDSATGTQSDVDPGHRTEFLNSVSCIAEFDLQMRDIDAGVQEHFRAVFALRVDVTLRGNRFIRLVTETYRAAEPRIRLTKDVFTH